MRGRIVSYSGADGLGDVELEDGRVVRFGLAQCGTLAPIPGLAVEVPEVVPGRIRHQLRASRVLPADNVSDLPWLGARLVSYDHSTQLGVVELADGRTAWFSPGATKVGPDLARWLVASDAPVRVQVSGAAVLAIARYFIPDQERLPLPAQLALVQRAGFAAELTAEELGHLAVMWRATDAAERLAHPLAFTIQGDPAADAPLWGLLHAWYERHPEAARRDGYLSRRWAISDKPDPFADLAEFASVPPILQLVRMRQVMSTCTCPDPHWAAEVREIALDDVRGFHFHCYPELVSLYNAALANRGVTAKSFQMIEATRRRCVYMFVTDAVAARLSTERVIPFRCE